MAELTIEQLIKIILGLLVVVSVIAGLYLFFTGKIFDFFKNLAPTTELIRGLLYG